jgi:sporulation protein YlmC with PRC-barrel domain
MSKLLPAIALSAALSAIASPTLAVDENTQFTTSIPADAKSISLYYNEDVYDNQNNQLGDVNDILLDKGGNVQTAIVGVGGFLGAGEKDVAVPFKALKLTEKDNDRYLVMNTTKEALEKAPGYVYDSGKGVWLPAENTKEAQ